MRTVECPVCGKQIDVTRTRKVFFRAWFVKALLSGERITEGCPQCDSVFMYRLEGRLLTAADPEFEREAKS